MKLETYNFLFHPLHETHSTFKSAASVITTIALAALTATLYLFVFTGVHIYEWLKDDSLRLSDRKELPTAKNQVSNCRVIVRHRGPSPEQKARIVEMQKHQVQQNQIPDSAATFAPRKKV